MVLVVENRKLKGVWWKYGLGLAIVQLAAWLIVGLKLYPDSSVVDIFLGTFIVYASFIVFSFLPFICARLGLRRMMWCGLIGFAFGDLAYFMLRLYEPTRRLNLLPFTSYAQINAAFISFGLVIEFGVYVYRKVFEE